MITVGYVCHAPSEFDRMEDYGGNVVRVDFTDDLANDQIIEWVQRFKGRDLSLFATITVSKKDANALQWNAVRVWQIVRDQEISCVGIGLGNEENIANGRWEKDPKGYYAACVQTLDALRAERYTGVVFIGTISSLAWSNMQEWLRKLLRQGYKGLNWLAAMGADWSRFGCQIHRYPTALDPAAPAPGNNTLDQEYQRVIDIVGTECEIVLGEIGATDHNQTAEQAAGSIVYDLNRWYYVSQRNANVWLVLCYVWTENADPKHPQNLHYACMQGHADGTVTEKPQGIAIRNWVLEQRSAKP